MKRHIITEMYGALSVSAYGWGAHARNAARHFETSNP